MSLSLNSLRDAILTSLRGRRIGLDPDEFLLGPKGMRHAINSATSATTGTNLNNYGLNTVQSSTANKTWKLPDPVAGSEVKISAATASTHVHTISPVAATIVSTNGVAGSAIAMHSAGASVSLFGLSTSQWAVTGKNGSVTVTS